MVATLRLGLEGLKAFARSIPEALPHPSILSTNWRVQAEACPRLSWPLGRGTLFADPRVISAATAGSGPARQHFLNARDQGIFFSVGLSGKLGGRRGSVTSREKGTQTPVMGGAWRLLPTAGAPGHLQQQTSTSWAAHAHVLPLLPPAQSPHSHAEGSGRRPQKYRKEQETGYKINPFR